MTPIRPLRRDDLPAVAALYAGLVKRDPAVPVPGFVEFFDRTLLAPPLADPAVPSLVYDDPREGVVGVMGAHPRRYVFEERPVLLACSGPLIVHPAHRDRGLGALLLRQFLAGPQDMTFNDRMVDGVHTMWRLLGGVTDAGASIGWRRTLAPVGAAASTMVSRLSSRQKPPGGGAFATLDALAGRRMRPAPPDSGTTEPLTSEAWLDLLPRLRRQFALRPAYDDDFLTALFGAMETADLGDRLVRRLVRTADGRAAGAYVIYVAVHGSAHVVEVAAREDDAGLVLDHLLHDAAREGAVEVSGRVEPYLLGHLQARKCKLGPDYWAMVHSRDQALVAAALSGRALMTRLDGEWWMRPRAELY